MQNLTANSIIGLLVGCVQLIGAGSLTADAPTGKVRVFVLAGQSNMEGKGSVLVMNHQLTIPQKRERFQRYREGDAWAERSDVSIVYLGNRGRRSGPLTVGYGISQPVSRKLFGPELGFGWTVGDAIEDPVLIIKTAWGGKSLDRDFRPPSRELPDSATDQFSKVSKRDPKLTLDQYQQGYGHFYRLMIEEVRQVTSQLATHIPAADGRGFEISGFVWFQGWNDQYAPTSVEDYEENLAALIRDVRADLESPQLPVVIGAMGHHGDRQSGKIKSIADAQVAVAQRPEWQGRVVTLRTADHWDNVAQAAFEKHWANPETRDIEQWRQYGNDRPYHYLGSPVFFHDVGVAFGDAMLGLID